jgi:GH35 family endo-1,4-beta-xylanase
MARWDSEKVMTMTDLPRARAYILLALYAAVLMAFAQAAPLRAATALLDSDTVATVSGYSKAGDTVTPVAVSDPLVPFTRALRVNRSSSDEFAYSAAMIWTTRAAVKKGDLLVATVYLRNVIGNRLPLRLELSFQLSDAPYTSTLLTGTPVDTRTWQKFAIPFRATQDFPSGQSSLQVRYGHAVQTFDVGGVAVANHGQVADPIPAAIANTFAAYYPGRGDPNAAWRTAALARIERHRKGDMTVRVTSASGAPLPNASVNIVQTDSSFKWGSAVSAISLVCNAASPGDSTRPCPTEDLSGKQQPLTPADYRKLRAELLANFNSSSFYNDLKWTDWHNDQQIALDGIAWMKRKGLKLWRGHNLIWPSFEPDYLMPRDIIYPSLPAADMRRVIAQHFAQQLGQLKGQITEWDVVNEPFANYDVQGRIASPGVTASRGILGPAAVATWFKDARRLDPTALLFLNDYAIFENLNPTAQKYDLALVKYIQSLGAPVDGIGFQAHFGQSGGLVFSDLQRVILEFSPLVKRFSVTEFDITSIDPKYQADLTEDFMTFIFSQPKFHIFQMWGFWDGDHWLGSAPLYTRDWRLKPSGRVWQRLTRETWRTRANGVSGGTGEYKLRAFYGSYKITVTAGGKTCEKSLDFLRPAAIAVPMTC